MRRSGKSYTDFTVMTGGTSTANAKAPRQLPSDLRAPSDAALLALLARLPNDGTSPYCDTYKAWTDFGLALWGATGGEGDELWLEWCAAQPQSKYDPTNKWETYTDTGIGWDTLCLWEKLHGTGDREALAGALFDDGVDVTAIAGEDAAIAKPVVLAPALPEPTSKMARRPWLYGRRLLRGYLSSTIAAGGTGKSSLTTVEAVSMATGRDLLNVGLDHMPRTPLRVLLWNGEDPLHELQLRFNAVCSHYALAAADFAGSMFMVSGRDHPLRLGHASYHKKDLAWLRGVIKGNRIDVVIVDPFVSSHRVVENDNMAIDGVAKAWSALAEEMGCAVDLVHHIRKPSNGAGVDLTVDDARGASALVNASRNARVLSPMPEKIAKDTGTANRRAYFAIQHDATKANMVPGVVGASWFRFVSVDMGNGDPFPADGGRPIAADSVGVVETCVLSPSVAAIPANIVAAQGAMGTKDWRAHPSAKEWVGIPIGGALGLDPHDKSDRRVIEGVVQAWLKDGWLKSVEKLDIHRMKKEFIEVGNEPEDAEF